MGNIVVGDVWVMYGQSNMAYPLRQVTNRDTESAQANLPNLRLFSISTNEQADLMDDIDREKIDTKAGSLPLRRPHSNFPPLDLCSANRFSFRRVSPSV